MDITAFPNKVDGAGPIGRTFIRQGQIRYTHEFDDDRLIAVALENPRGDFDDADDPNLDDGLPDLSARYRIEGERWHLQFGGVLRRMGYDDGAVEDEATGWGLHQSGSFLMPGSRDRFAWYINFGDGIGRYIDGGLDHGASFDTTTGDLDTQFGYGGFVTYRHWWDDKWQSNIDIGTANFDLNPAAAGDADEHLISSRVNVIWLPANNMEFGLEYVWGRREVHDGRKGGVSRLMMMSIYYF
jgi:hypothetical protein